MDTQKIGELCFMVVARKRYVNVSAYLGEEVFNTVGNRTSGLANTCNLCNLFNPFNDLFDHFDKGENLQIVWDLKKCP